MLDKTRKSEIEKEAAKILLDTKSVLFNSKEPFTFTSGRISPVYIDCRRLISFTEERSDLMDMAIEILQDIEGIDIVAGGETAGIPYSAFISERLHKPMAYIRKKPKGFGRMAQIEGHFHDIEKPNVLLVEDLQTDGGSKKVFINALRDSGAEISHAFVVFHYNIFEASKKNMDEMGITLHNLTDWWNVLEVAREGDYFDADTLDSVEKFLNAPDIWAEANQEKSGNGSFAI